MTLLEKIQNRSAVVGVVGLGYVGLPLALLQVKTGFRVVGMEEDRGRVGQLRDGKSYIGDVRDADLARAVNEHRLSVDTSFDRLWQCAVVLICVPTPLTANKQPDLSAIRKVTRGVAQRVRPDTLVVLESTSYPGTTEEVIVPEFARRGFEIGRDVFLAFSPERVDPGNPAFDIDNTFKLVGGVTPRCHETAQYFYQQSVAHLFPVSSPRAAEMTKVYENVFRSVNIALANELAMLCDRMGLNVHEVIAAAATKNFGFMPFFPGPGVGGHCIPLDPYYLSWKSKAYDFQSRFIELAGEINGGMPAFVVGKLQRILNRRRRCLNGATILVLGVTYKADVGDPRESPATKVMELLHAEGGTLRYVDPYTPTLTVGGRQHAAAELSPALLATSDVCLILTAHSTFDYEMVVEHAPVVFDTRNGTRDVQSTKDNVVLL